MDEKTRLRELIDFFCLKMGWEFEDTDLYELNGYEGLLAWGADGLFYQMNYKSDSVWHITMFPYDIYGKRKYVEGEWV